MSSASVFMLIAMGLMGDSSPQLRDLEAGWIKYGEVASAAQGKYEEVVTDEKGKEENRFSLDFNSGTSVFSCLTHITLFHPKGTKTIRHLCVANNDYAFKLLPDDKVEGGWMVHFIAVRSNNEEQFNSISDNSNPFIKTAATRLWEVRLIDIVKSPLFKLTSLDRVDASDKRGMVRLKFQFSGEQSSESAIRFPFNGGELTLSPTNAYALQEARLETDAGAICEMRYTYSEPFHGVALLTATQKSIYNKNGVVTQRRSGIYNYRLTESPLKPESARLTAYGFHEPELPKIGLAYDRRMWFLGGIALLMLLVAYYWRHRKNAAGA